MKTRKRIRNQRKKGKETKAKRRKEEMKLGKNNGTFLVPPPFIYFSQQRRAT